MFSAYQRAQDSMPDGQNRTAPGPARRTPDGPVRLPRSRVLEMPADDVGGVKVEVTGVHPTEALRHIATHHVVHHRNVWHPSQTKEAGHPNQQAATGEERRRMRAAFYAHH